MLCFQPAILLLDQTDDLGVGNKQVYSLLKVAGLRVYSMVLPFGILSSGGLRYRFLLFKIPWWNWAQERLKL